MKKNVMKNTLLFGALTLLCGCSAVVGGGKGPAGDPGQSGENGKDGQDGATAYELYVKEHPDYTGNLEQWMDDLVNGRLADCANVNGFVLLKMPDGNDGILGYFGGYKDELVIPSEYMDTPITSILSYAFANCSVGKLVFPSTIERIEKEAFYESRIDTIVGTEGVKYIGYCAFSSSCIETVPLGDSLTYIGDYAFSYSDIKNIVIPSSVTYIGAYAFSSSKLETFRMDACDPNLTMGNSVFLQASYLKDVVLPSNLKEIPVSTFASSNIKSIELPDELVTVKDNAFANSMLEEVIFNSKIESINAAAFSVTNLSSLVLPGSISHVGYGAFGSCMKLARVRIEEGVDMQIESEAFTNCPLLDEAYIPLSVKTMGSSVFNLCLAGTVYCAAPSKPDGWNSGWLGSSSNYMDVVWGYAA